MLMNDLLERYRGQGLAGLSRAVARRVLPSRMKRLASDPSPLTPVLAQLGQLPSLRVIQIGAYIGDTSNDPLVAFIRNIFPSHPDARSILVEPVKGFYDQLVINYAGTPGLIFENVAIADAEGEREFHHLGTDPVAHGYPEWLSQLGSLRNDRMTELWQRYENNPDLQRFYLANKVVSTVSCTTIKTLMAKHDFGHVDLLQIDAEGYDYDILKTLDFDECRPRYINYERVLLQDREAECRDMMRRAGYVLKDWGQDTLCTRR